MTQTECLSIAESIREYVISEMDVAHRKKVCRRAARVREAARSPCGWGGVLDVCKPAKGCDENLRLTTKSGRLVLEPHIYLPEPVSVATQKMVMAREQYEGAARTLFNQFASCMRSWTFDQFFEWDGCVSKGYGALVHFYLPIEWSNWHLIPINSKKCLSAVFDLMRAVFDGLGLTDAMFEEIVNKGDGGFNQEMCRKDVAAQDGDNTSKLFDVVPKDYTGCFDSSLKAQIIHVPDLLALDLRIPDYQRPYKWSGSSVQTLLDDIRDLIENCPHDRAYRIGSVILHDTGDGVCNIVDGQQRALTLILLTIALGLGSRFANDEKFFVGLSQSKESAAHLRHNFRTIVGYFTDQKFIDDPILLEKFKVAVERQLEIVVITVKQESEAFQLFDCQNTRGRKLGPQDLLKAFHLREIKDVSAQERAAKAWDWVESGCDKDDKSSPTITHGDLFNLYLYRILKWGKGEKPGEFTEKDIDLFKGVPRMGLDGYGYARRAAKAMPFYQIGDDFISGGDFFEMVKLYRGLYTEVVRQLGESESIRRIIIDLDDGSKAFSYAKQLFYASVLAYRDRFGRYDESAARRLCAWAFMLRVDLRKVGDKSIVKYAIGGEDLGSRYTNHISMFMKIRQARRHTEITNMVVDFPAEDKVDAKRKNLWVELKNLIGA